MTELSTKSGFKNIAAAVALPVAALLAFYLHHHFQHWLFMVVAAAFLIASVLGAVHHAEVISHRVGEPFGALVLAISITIIEASIIVSLMLAEGDHSATLARDTVFAAVMIILTGMMGATLLIGGIKFKEQSFNTDGVSSYLTVLVAISVLTLVLPNYTEAVKGPYYSTAQLIFVAVVTLVLYFVFLFVQNFRHKTYFLVEEDTTDSLHKPTNAQAALSLVCLLLNLTAVVLLAESLAPNLDAFVVKIGAPPSLSGIIIAMVILLPEGISAIKAASANKMQKSLNLSLGSALASISLTIPVVAFISLFVQKPLALGIDTEETVLFLLALFVMILCLSKGKTTILQGLVLLILFCVYLFITIFP